MIRYVTSGESHGKQLTVIVEGIPAGLKLSEEEVNSDLARRQKGFGRGERMKLETDKAEFVSGMRWGKSIGSPITLVIKNADWENNKKLMSSLEKDLDEKNYLLRPRPGHADLAGILKYATKDIRNILERSSARETAARVAAGAVCRKLAKEFGIIVYSFVRQIGEVEASCEIGFADNVVSSIEKSELRVADASIESEMKKEILKAKLKGDTLGGVFTVVAKGLPVGLGSHTQWDMKLDGRLAQSLMSIQAVKGVEFGLGFGLCEKPGSESHDEIFYSPKKGFYRTTNNAGGLEGGMTNGENLVVNCVMKPIPSLMKPLNSVNIKTKKAEKAEAVRSDVCAVPAAGVVGEAAVSFELARAMKEKFGGDSIEEMKRNFQGYIQQVKKY
jgi:chorismate synthase